MDNLKKSESSQQNQRYRLFYSTPSSSLPQYDLKTFISLHTAPSRDTKGFILNFFTHTVALDTWKHTLTWEIGGAFL